MNAKAYLMQIEELNREIRRLQLRLDDINAQKYSIKSPANMEGLPGGTRDEKLLSLIQKSEKYEKQITRKKAVLMVKKETVSRKIDRIGKQKLCDVLYLRYVRCMSWRQVARKMNYSEDWVKALHAEALQAFEKVMKDNTKKHD